MKDEPSAKAVSDFIKGIVDMKDRASEISQEVTAAAKAAKEAGVNVPAARIAERIYRMALDDPLKARVLFEDLLHYLDLMNFDKIAPESLFQAAEVHSVEARPAA